MPNWARPATEYRHLKRYSQVIQVLIRHGFGQFVDQLHLWEKTSIRRRIPKVRDHGIFIPRTRAARMRLVLEDLGPTFIKLGQFLSTRPDLVPFEYITELEKLQNRVEPVSNALAMRVVQAQLGRNIDEIFSSFEEEPVAAASLSQVYRAVLKTGEKVATIIKLKNIAYINFIVFM